MSFEGNSNFFALDVASINAEVLDATPPECVQCPVQCTLGGELGSLILRKHIMDFAAGHLVGDDGAQFDAMVDASVPAGQAEELNRSLRQQAAEDMDEVDSAMGKIKAQMNFNAASCDSVLKMRANKAGTTYTVSVCTSTEVYEQADDDHLPTHITTKKTK